MDPIIAASFAEALTHRMANANLQNPHGPGGEVKESNESCLRLFDPEAYYKVRKITSKVNDCFHMLANEPSLGLYRMQEHVHRTIPGLVDRKKELDSLRKKVEGVSYDMDYSISAIDSIGNIRQFTNISEALKSAISLKSKLEEKENLEKVEKDKQAAVAHVANRSISQNEIAEGYICPICYYAHENQEALMAHWKTQHSLESYENEVFGNIELTEEFKRSATGPDNTDRITGSVVHHSECEEASEHD